MGSVKTFFSAYVWEKAGKGTYVYSVVQGNTTGWSQYVSKDDLEKHFPGYKYIFSSGSYPRIEVIASDDGAIHLRLATSDNNYKQIRVNDQGVYADWVGDTTITKQIVTKQ